MIVDRSGILTGRTRTQINSIRLPRCDMIVGCAFGVLVDDGERWETSFCFSQANLVAARLHTDPQSSSSASGVLRRNLLNDDVEA
jgi:hypothetical protein